MRTRIILLSVFCFLALFSLALSAPIEFGAKVSEWDPSSTLPASMTLAISEGNEISIQVTNFTEVKNDEGFPASLSDVAEGDWVEVKAILTSGGWVALEIQIQDEESEIELMGPVDSLEDSSEGTFLTVNGFQLRIVEGITKIRNEFGAWIDLESFRDLVEGSPSGLMVKVEAVIVDSTIVSKTVKVLSRFVSISLEGIVEGDFDGSTLNLNLGDGMILPVIVTGETEILGEPTDLIPGTPVQVKGFINSELAVEALRIRVRELFRLIPDELHLSPSADAKVQVVLVRALDFPLVLNLVAEDPAIADVVSPTDKVLNFLPGDTSSEFSVLAGALEGKTAIRVMQEGAEANCRALKVEVGEQEEGDEEEPALELKWTPGVIHAAPNGSVEARLMLKYGVAPEDLEVILELQEWTGDPAGISFPGQVVIPGGENEVRFLIEFSTDSGSGGIRATLPASAGGGSDDLEIELVPSNPEANAVKLRWVPADVKLETGATASVELVLMRPAPEPFDVTITIDGDPATATLSSMVVSFATGDTVASPLQVTAGEEEGTVVFQAVVPDELGGDQARLKVRVEEDKSKKNGEGDGGAEDDGGTEGGEEGTGPGKKTGKGN